MDRDEHGLPPPDAPLPATRAADSDRDRTLELLATAASDGRLTLEEYSGRADRALAATLMSELAELTVDLQRAATLPERGPDELTAILSNETRKGHWTVPPRLAARSVLGDCHIELQDAVLTSHVTTIEARATLGSVTIFVPDGVEVRLWSRTILGANTSEVTSKPLPGAPIIEVRARSVLGNVTVRPTAR